MTATVRLARNRRATIAGVRRTITKATTFLRQSHRVHITGLPERVGGFDQLPILLDEPEYAHGLFETP